MRKRKSYGAVLVQNFDNFKEAEAAVLSLIEAGLTASEISVVVAKDQTLAGNELALLNGIGPAPLDEAEQWCDGISQALSGGGKVEAPGVGIVLAGPLIAVLREEKATLNGSPLSRALCELGMEKQEADHYRRRAEAGEIIVIAAASVGTSEPPLP